MRGGKVKEQEEKKVTGRGKRRGSFSLPHSQFFFSSFLSLHPSNGKHVIRRFSPFPTSTQWKNIEISKKFRRGNCIYKKKQKIKHFFFITWGSNNNSSENWDLEPVGKECVTNTFLA